MNSQVIDILSLEEQTTLLQIARETIGAVTHQQRPVMNKDYQHTVFNEKFGAFVTLHKNKQLRGCIGYVQAVKPLLETIMEMAEAAALRDPRFDPVEKHEVDDLEIEISVLTPMHRLSSIEEIHIGEHGLYIEKGYRRGLLLPQVATENEWDVETFLQHTCIKAGLKESAWKDQNADIFIFSAQIFTEPGK